jgi:hypothetical protein
MLCRSARLPRTLHAITFIKQVSLLAVIFYASYNIEFLGKKQVMHVWMLLLGNGILLIIMQPIN